MRRWQVAKLREAGLDPYMRGTWQEAQAAIAQQSKPVIVAQEIPVPIIAQTGISDVTVWPTASDRTCPHCGKLCMHAQALKWHLKGCKARPEATA